MVVAYVAGLKPDPYRMTPDAVIKAALPHRDLARRRERSELKANC